MQLGFDFETPALVRVTPARLGVWRDCPRRYRLTYLDKPAPPRGGAWAHTTLGAVVHLALRAFLDLPPARRSGAQAMALVDANWSSEGFRDAEQATEYRERAKGWVADYVAELPAEFEPVAQEQWVTAQTDRIVAEGRVDRVDRRGDELVVVDYKTGRTPTVTDARESTALALYAVATARTLRRACTQVELHHVPSGTVVAWQHDAASLAGHVSAAEATAAALATATDELAAGGDPDTLFPPRPGARCGSCDMRRHCPEGRAAAELRPSWSLLAS